MGDGSKEKDGGKPAKKPSKSKSKKKEKKEDLEDLKKELEIVRKHIQCNNMVILSCHAEIVLIFCRIGTQLLSKICVAAWKQTHKRLVQILYILFIYFS